MKKLLMFICVGMLLGGCGSDEAATDATEKIDGEPVDKVLAEAVDADSLQMREVQGQPIFYKSGSQTPYTGWAKQMHASGQKDSLGHWKEGKQDGAFTSWYENGKKSSEARYKDGKKDGVWIFYNEDGTEESRRTYKDGERVN